VPTDYIMHIRLTRRLLGLAIFAWLVGVASPAAAQPTADEVLAGLGLSADDKQRVLNGEFVSTNVEPVSERDLAVSIVFIVKTSPASLIKQVLSGRLITSDSQVQSWALFKNPGSAADLAGLTITNGEARTLARASPGSSLNLNRAEIAAFNAVPDGNPAGVLQTLRAMLLARRAGELLVDEVDHTGHHDLRAPAPNGRRRWRCLGRGAAAVLRQRGLQWPASGRGLPADPGRHPRRLHEPRLHRSDHGVRGIHEAQHGQARHGEPDQADLRGGTQESAVTRVDAAGIVLLG